MLRFVIEVFRNGTTAKGGLVVREHSRASQLNVIEAIFDLLLCSIRRVEAWHAQIRNTLPSINID